MFSFPESSDVFILHGEHSVSLVILSIAIACCAAYTALSMNQRMQQTSFFHKNFWLLLSSIAMGLGIWSMHFIGMSAFMLPISMKYDLLLTIISVIPAVFASYLAFYFANRRNTSHRFYIIAGAIMGLGISSMHYIGMAAMKMDAEYVYKPGIFIISILIAVVASYIALYTFSTLQKYMRNQLIKIITSILLGLAITSMHYTGMAAIVFYVRKPLAENLNEMHHMDMTLLIAVVTIGISLLLLISGLTSLLDRYVDHRLHHFDALTLLPNQRQFEQELNNMITDGTLAIVHIHNLEKWITSYGYTFGDEMIKAVGDIIKSGKPLYAKVYRIEGNRFAIFQFGTSDYEIMKESMKAILSVLEKPLGVDNKQIVINAVCAISHSSHKRVVRELFSSSMAVLQHPSIEYNHEVIEYDPAIHTFTFESQIAQDISRAITNQELFLEYQPKVCSKTFEVSGVEALLRWNHPVYGLISPGVFIPILEDNGEIFDATDWVIEEACHQVSLWLEEGVPFRQVSINIPGSYVTSSRLLKVMNKNLLKYKVDSHYIELEITETSVIHDIENAITAVGRFRDLGLSVALDDFGTGLSSLSYLKRMPISTIKIDKSFVDGVPLSEKDSAVLRSIIILCYSLKLNIVIEGVETKEQMDFIGSMREKPFIQGYYFSRPLTVKEIGSWITRGTPMKLLGM
ncbi:putative bifunctional diguanylate cyclase/phosphodiesterase [Virgibacillus sp. W0181]|uniref:putative bifunctional diguanylate cyclase/phosphodiesterase n=1 Tax=Virgibacillus sp. W0181 TaxID=3391581 RepID=UPI003F471288